MDLHDRITEAREAAGLSKSELARRMGLSRASVSAWETGAVKNLKNEHLFTLSEITGYSAKWIATGEGEKKRSVASAKVAYLRPDRHITNDAAHKNNDDELEFMGMEAWDSQGADPGVVELPMYREVESVMGSGETEVQVVRSETFKMPMALLEEAGIDPQDAACARVTGNSMGRLIPDGTTVGVHTAPGAIRDGDIYAIDHSGLLRIKYLYRLPGGGLKLRSENSEEYPDETYTGAEVRSGIKIIGRVFFWYVLR